MNIEERWLLDEIKRHDCHVPLPAEERQALYAGAKWRLGWNIGWAVGDEEDYKRRMNRITEILETVA